MLQVPSLTVGIILSPRSYLDRVYAEAGGAANALKINMESTQMATNHEQLPEPIDRRRLIISTTSSLLILVLCLFLPAGTWSWAGGWLFLFVLVVASIAGTLYLRRVNPEVIAARINRREGTRRRDWNLG